MTTTKEAAASGTKAIKMGAVDAVLQARHDYIISEMTAGFRVGSMAGWLTTREISKSVGFDAGSTLRAMLEADIVRSVKLTVEHTGGRRSARSKVPTRFWTMKGTPNRG